MFSKLNGCCSTGRRAMANKPRKCSRDFSQAAKLVVDIATGQKPDRDPRQKNRARTRLRLSWDVGEEKLERLVRVQNAALKLLRRPQLVVGKNSGHFLYFS
jgi:hypothetical protein